MLHSAITMRRFKNGRIHRKASLKGKSKLAPTRLPLPSSLGAGTAQESANEEPSIGTAAMPALRPLSESPLGLWMSDQATDATEGTSSHPPGDDSMTRAIKKIRRDRFTDKQIAEQRENKLPDQSTKMKALTRQQIEGRESLSRKEAGHFFGYSERTIRSFVRNGQLNSTQRKRIKIDVEFWKMYDDIHGLKS